MQQELNTERECNSQLKNRLMYCHDNFYDCLEEIKWPCSLLRHVKQLWDMSNAYSVSIFPYEEKLCNKVFQLDNFTVHFRFGANREDKSILRSNPLW